MSRLFFVSAIFLAGPFFNQAQEPQPTETVIRLQVQPMRAPTPALRYQLLPELRDLNPGNPVLGFIQSFSGLQAIFNKSAMKEYGWDKWTDIPLKDLPREKMRGYGDNVVRQAIYAGRLDAPDWQVLVKLKKDGLKELTEDVAQFVPVMQNIRELAQVLAWRLRVEIADRRFDDALITAQTMLALARTVGEYPGFLADLVGMSITQIAVEPIEEMIRQPGSPNLFWALTILPHPIIDLRLGLQGERIWFQKFFSQLDDKRPMTNADTELVLNNFKTYFPANKKNKPLGDVILEMAKDKKLVQAVRQRLVNAGLTEAVIQRFSDLQVIILDGKLYWEKRQDDVIALMVLPFWQAEPMLTKSLKTFDHPFAQFVPPSSFSTVQRASARNEQRFALLRCVEGLRVHAAEHDGNLPARLEDIRLPLPIDPISGRAFHYKLEDSTAHIRGSPAPGMEKNPFYNIHYEITIQK